MAVVGSTGWTPHPDETFNYGGVAAATKSVLSGMTDEERAKQKKRTGKIRKRQLTNTSSNRINRTCKNQAAVHS